MSKAMLEKHGWRLIQRTRAGCMIIAWWRDPRDGEVIRQAQAVLVQRVRNRAAKMRQTQPVVDKRT